ncbi:MAG TPA: altronate dehydratase family protein [Acidobacteriaceae bacterium]|nr:altronate dehydratase family protein [Acidobacteriaceae bacterium]
MAADKTLRIDPKDNVIVALTQLNAGATVTAAGEQYILQSDIPAKQKFATRDLDIGDEVIMYGGVVGLVREVIPKGGLLSTRNVQHDASGFGPKVGEYAWSAPDVSAWYSRTFDGYHRADGQVGTRNYWLVIPLVFCENRNVEALREAFEEELGYGRPKLYREQVRQLIARHSQGTRATERVDFAPTRQEQVFPNVDGVRFLLHEGGCGGTRQDSKALCGLLAGYIHHPNVAGATVLSLGCQNAQPSILMDALRERDPDLRKPVLMYEQQKSGLESDMLSDAIRATFEGLVEANRLTRQPAPLSKLNVALKCGGSDGFSGISANPALGHVSDMVAALGGKSILAEFPELCGMEQNLINRCVEASQANRFIQLMRDYAARARAVHSGFEMNPSPGNIRDGLITDAMKSAGAARKGGTSPVTAVLDYPEYDETPGLALLCTPGNDVECVTAQVGAGANVVLFTTGLGTPTGNPIAPVIKVSTNSSLADRMSDIIDIDTGAVIRGEATIQQVGESILELILKVASGKVRTKAEQHYQNDFIPWKRGVSL